ncbi:MAG: 50S ribosomal protein L20 [Candidatus Bipolaricaulia bacterium]
MRVNRGNIRRKRRKRIMRQAKGFRGKRNSAYRMAKQRVLKAQRNAYISRRLRKRDFRKLWITRINAASRLNGLPYSRFMQGLREADVQLNRKMLAEMAVRDPEGFAAVVELAKEHLPEDAKEAVAA